MAFALAWIINNLVINWKAGVVTYPFSFSLILRNCIETKAKFCGLTLFRCFTCTDRNNRLANWMHSEKNETQTARTCTSNRYTEPSLNRAQDFKHRTGFDLKVWPLSCLVPRPHYYGRQMRFGSRGPRKCFFNRSAVPWVRHRNFLTERAWKDAVQGLGKVWPRMLGKQN